MPPKTARGPTNRLLLRGAGFRLRARDSPATGAPARYTALVRRLTPLTPNHRTRARLSRQTAPLVPSGRNICNDFSPHDERQRDLGIIWHRHQGPACWGATWLGTMGQVRAESIGITFQACVVQTHAPFTARARTGLRIGPVAARAARTPWQRLGQRRTYRVRVVVRRLNQSRWRQHRRRRGARRRA